MAIVSGRKATPVMIEMKSRHYMNCSHALKDLKLGLYRSDIEEYSFIPTYMAVLNSRGHEAKLEIVDIEFMRLSITFREGFQQYKSYSTRRISVNGSIINT